jgi:Spy/CpxP family protein refolding chaperone
MNPTWALSLLLLAAAAPAPPPADDDAIARTLFPPELVMRHGSEIGLDEEQREAIKGAVQGAQARFVDVQWDLQSETEKMLALLRARPVDEAAVSARVDKLLSLEREIKKAQLILLARIKNLLSEAQLVRLTELRDRERGGPADPGLPELHVIRTITLSPSYGCRPRDVSGYEGSALFLSEERRRRNSPDLLFNGACGSADSFEASLAGDDMSLVGDLGANVPLEEVTASRAFNWRRVAAPSDYTRFVQKLRVELGHTYAVLLNGRERRGLLVFTVIRHVPNKQVDVRYAVEGYQILSPRAESPGWDWGRPNR